MFRLYSKGCAYAIRALIDVGASQGSKPLAAREVFRKARIPEPFTRKVFQALVRGRFLKAVSGPGGGYTLTRTPKEITIRHIIEAVDGEETFARCVMGLPVCDDKNACPLHESWVRAKRQLLGELDSKTLQDLIDTVKKSGRRNPGLLRQKTKKRSNLT